MGLTLYPADPVGMLFVGVFVGAVLGFLRSNLSHRRIFLGDAGSMLLGLWLAGLSLGLGVRTPSLPLVVVVAMAIPILDTATTIWRRRRRGLSIFRADDEHLHHRLLRLGMSPGRATATLWFTTVAFASLGTVIDGRQSGAILAVGALVAMAIELAYTLPREGRPRPAEAIAYLLGLRDQLGDGVTHRQLAEIIEMPRFSSRPAATGEKRGGVNMPAASAAPSSPQPDEAALKAAKATEGGAAKDDVVLALGDENQ